MIATTYRKPVPQQRWWVRPPRPHHDRATEVLAVLQHARAIVEAGWVQNRWTVTTAPAETSTASESSGGGATPGGSVQACVVAAVAMADYYHAQFNPRAVMYGHPLTREQYDKSRWIVEPFHLYDCCMENDGSAALIVTTADRARDGAPKGDCRPPGARRRTAKNHFSVVDRKSGARPRRRRGWSSVCSLDRSRADQFPATRNFRPGDLDDSRLARSDVCPGDLITDRSDFRAGAGASIHKTEFGSYIERFGGIDRGQRLCRSAKSAGGCPG